MDEEMPQIDEDIASSLSDIFGTSLLGSEPEPDLERASDEGEIIKDFDEVEEWALQGEVSEEEETGVIINEEEIVPGGEREEELKSEEMVEEIFQILEEEPEEQGDQADQAPPEVESEPSGKQFETSSNLALEYANQALSRGEIEDALEQYAEFIQQDFALDEIIQNLKMALDRSPLDFNLWQTLGDAYARNNMLPDALIAYSKAEELLN
jgi:tetratricopeptide (TPR) repeat protein